jgi:hypothetical protein
MTDPQRQWNPRTWRRDRGKIDWFRWDAPRPVQTPMMTYPFPLRAGKVIARLVLPLDLTEQEAERLRRHMRALAVDPGPEREAG